MDVDQFLRSASSRRSFFHTAGVSFAGGSAVLLAACGSDDKKDTATQTSTGGNADVAILNSALDLENTAVAAYTAGAVLLRGNVLAAAKQFRAQEQEHADGIAQAIKDRGGTPNKPKASYDFPALKSETDVLRFAVDLENTAVAAYIDAIPKLTDPKLRGTASAILTDEAEHISVLLGALNLPQVPNAFVVGT